jgi:tRNA uridine 5-carbamoylmethylation protein Kti12
MDKHRNNLKRKMKLIIVIGLPASGKTTYYNENLKNSHLFYDDFVSNIFDGELIESIKKGNQDICIADPRLCNPSIFTRIMKVIEEYIDISNINLILFENDKTKCFINSKKRNNKNVDKTIEFLSNIYHYDNYKNYNFEIIKIKN